MARRCKRNGYAYGERSRSWLHLIIGSVGSAFGGRFAVDYNGDGAARRRPPTSGVVEKSPTPDDELPHWEELTYHGDEFSSKARLWRLANETRVENMRRHWLRAAGDTREISSPSTESGCVTASLLAACATAADLERRECLKILQQHRLESNFTIQGSARDFWGFQEDSDFDLLRSEKRQPGWQVTNTLPGLCRLERPARIESPNNLRRLLKRLWPESSLLRQVMSPKRLRDRMTRLRMRDCRPKTLTEQGPAVTQKFVFGDGQVREVDFVSSLRLKRWPKFLMSEWLPRHGARFDDFRTGVGRIHLVPIGGFKGERRDESHAFRYSYHELESAIIGRFCPLRGACYALMKKLHHKRLKQFGFKSYHVKTAVLWLNFFQPSDSWQADSLLTLARTGLLLMLRCAEAKFMPNYFMPNESVMRQPMPRALGQAEVRQLLLDDLTTAAKEATLSDMNAEKLTLRLEALNSEIRLALNEEAKAEAADPTNQTCRHSPLACRFNCCTGDRLDPDCNLCDSLQMYISRHAVIDGLLRVRIGGDCDGLFNRLSRMLSFT